MRLDDVLGVFMAISQQTIFDPPISLTVSRQVGESTCKASLPLFGPLHRRPFHSSLHWRTIQTDATYSGLSLHYKL
jgi:hypothetical protein